MLAGSVFILFYLIKFSPFILGVDQFLNIFSTLILALLYLFCFLFSLLPPSSLLEILGYVFVGLVVFLFAVNVLTIIISKIKSCLH